MVFRKSFALFVLACPLAIIAMGPANGDHEGFSDRGAKRQCIDCRLREIDRIFMGTCEDEGCGICERPGAEMFWLSPHSRCAHRACFVVTRPALQQAYDLIDAIPEDPIEKFGPRNDARIAMARQVRAACGDRTILQASEQFGEEDFNEIVGCASICAVEEYIAARKEYLAAREDYLRDNPEGFWYADDVSARERLREVVWGKR